MQANTVQEEVRVRMTQVARELAELATQLVSATVASLLRVISRLDVYNHACSGVDGVRRSRQQL